MTALTHPVALQIEVEDQDTGAPVHFHKLQQFTVNIPSNFCNAIFFGYASKTAHDNGKRNMMTTELTIQGLPAPGPGLREWIFIKSAAEAPTFQGASIIREPAPVEVPGTEGE